GTAPRPSTPTVNPNAKIETEKAEKPEVPVASKQEIPAENVQRYKLVISGLEKLRKTQLDLFAKYTPESQVIKANQADIDDLEKQRRELEKKYPDLPTKVGPVSSSNGKELDPAAEAARLAGLQAKRDALADRVKDVQERMHQLSQLGPQIEDLERQ